MSGNDFCGPGKRLAATLQYDTTGRVILTSGDIGA